MHDILARYQDMQQRHRLTVTKGHRRENLKPEHISISLQNIWTR